MTRIIFTHSLYISPTSIVCVYMVRATTTSSTSTSSSSVIPALAIVVPVVATRSVWSKIILSSRIPLLLLLFHIIVTSYNKTIRPITTATAILTRATFITRHSSRCLRSYHNSFRHATGTTIGPCWTVSRDQNSRRITGSAAATEDSNHIPLDRCVKHCDNNNVKNNMDQQPPSSSSISQPQPLLSQEQLRWKRLVAFGIEHAVPITTTTTTNHVTATEVVSLLNQNTPPQKPRSRPRPSEVIDLLDDTTDDDNENEDETDPNVTFHRRKRDDCCTIGCTPTDHKDDPSIQIRPRKKTLHDWTTGTTTGTSTEGEAVRSNHTRTMKTWNATTCTNDSERDIKPHLSSMDQNDNSNSTTTFNGCFQVATWNVWFGPWGDGNPHSNLRMKAIVRLLMEQHQQQPQLPLYCIGFQEVVTETIRPLKSLLQSQSYHWFEQPSRTVPYKCAMAIHTDLHILDQGWIPYTNTVMQRGFLYVRAKLPSCSSTNTTNHNSNNHKNEIIFTTTHLESYNGKDYNGAPQRLLQIQEMCQFLNDQMEEHSSISVAIISGDLNWDDERRTARSNTTSSDPILLSSIPSHWKDTWLEAMQPPLSSSATMATTKRKKSTTKTSTAALAEGYTYDSKLNPMLSGSLRRRFDRVLVCQNHHHPSKHSNGSTKTQPSSLQILAPQLLGTQVISPDLTWEKYNMYTRTTRDVPTAPSDHFGYIVTLRLEGDK